ncbi:MAG: hypothetical protein CMK83_18025 [Pseudomonadales bacterium]|jgi:hypothetical protein|uniref:hypothetical protein n=1 Tax=unclassified Ketobacter TaxID=2639109 RepID=UPI000C499376|nr:MULTISPECIES: hypothetical protein [unclassified Ketobacter]MAA59789.1 hypothetical protein [Pseudomonadales bacterium]MEC8810840.1 hypothetical protein [Pseudomonadota bacterium]TNC86786.1 MAG: hypothetical protein CSH49_15925 [Alcanivorax sp.]HAG93703.1 hypothetical protein [Gammaproteobacteria bacterium]MAQ26107.1 hypothetical protein [Pseudomonadales bacterium]|tara:strand:- start:651 stop:1067 length:417 start_codon:yes stop_codon:yes gene_type:complete
MIQDKVKVQLDQLKKQSEKLQAELGKGLEVAKLEGQRILKELGVEADDKIELNELLAELRKANPTVRDFLRNLNVATYDNRFRFNWNATMISAYAKQQAEKAYAKDLKPRLAEVRDTVSAQLREVQSKTQELRAKITA